MTRDGFQLPLNITGALSCSQEEDHFADSPSIIVTLTSDKVRNWGQSEKRIAKNLDQDIDNDDKGFFY